LPGDSTTDQTIKGSEKFPRLRLQQHQKRRDGEGQLRLCVQRQRLRAVGEERNE